MIYFSVDQNRTLFSNALKLKTQLKLVTGGFPKFLNFQKSYKNFYNTTTYWSKLVHKSNISLNGPIINVITI